MEGARRLFPTAGSCECADCRHHATLTALGTGRLCAGWEVRPPQRGLEVLNSAPPEGEQDPESRGTPPRPLG